jgi:hypothetical protein
MKNWNATDLTIVAGALRGFIHGSEDSMEIYLNHEEAEMVMLSLLEKRRAERLLAEVLDAQDEYYERGES